MSPIHEIGDWRFDGNPDIDVIRQECQLARDRGQRVSLSAEQLLELLEMLSYVEEPGAVSPNEHHQLDDCEQCSDMEEEIDDLKDECDRLVKELVKELERADDMDGTSD